jgi:chaperonin cofactor prefoldin
MRHRLLILVATSLLSAAMAAAEPQNSPSGETGQNPGQTSSAAPGSSSATPAPASVPAAKKVWTNEDVGGLRENAPISTVGSTATKPGGKGAAGAKNKNAKPYQAQIARLEAQIPPLDSQIEQLQAAIDGKPTGDEKTSQRPRSVKADSWNVEMQELKEKRDRIEDQISSLKDEARHQGVAPNTLP